MAKSASASPPEGQHLDVVRKWRCVHGITVYLYHRIQNAVHEVRTMCGCALCGETLGQLADWVALPEAV